MKKQVSLYMIVAVILLLCSVTIHADSCSHVWSAWSTISEPTCIEIGEQYRYCTLCFENEYAEIPATGIHCWGEWEETQLPTCGTEGTETRYCDGCSKTESRSIAPTRNHIWGEKRTTVKATIKRTGKQKWICSECGTSQIASIPKLKAFVRFTKKNYRVKAGKSLVLKPKYANGDKVKKWKSSNQSVASVNAKGKLIAYKAGNTKVTVIMKSGKKASCKVTVTAVQKRTSSSSSSGTSSSGSGSSSSGSSGSSSSSGSSAGTGMVWLSATGSKYHSINNCGNMNPSKAWTVSLAQAISSGYERCSKCW